MLRNIHDYMTCNMDHLDALGLYVMCVHFHFTYLLCNVPRNEPTYSSAPSGI